MNSSCKQWHWQFQSCTRSSIARCPEQMEWLFPRVFWMICTSKNYIFFPLGHGDLIHIQDLMRRSLSLPLSHRHLIKCFFRCSPEKGLASSIASIDGAHDDTWDFVQTYFQTNRHIHHIPNSIYYIRVMANKYFPGNHDKLLSQ